MAVARRIYTNPANGAQKYVLYDNGVIDNLGGALPVPQIDWQQAVSQNKAPTWNSGDTNPAAALVIINWATPSGYTLDHWGFVYPWGGALAVPGATPPFTTGPDYYFGNNGGFQSPIFGNVIDFVMNPSGNGQGYILKYDGDLFPIGTGTVAVQRAPGITSPGSGRQVIMDWVSMRYWILDTLGRLIGLNGAVTGPLVGGFGYPQYVWGRGGPIITCGTRLYSLGATPKGFVLDAFGRAYEVDGALVPTGYQFTPSSRQWSDIAIVDDGTLINPLRLVALRQNGTTYEWVVSIAPYATVIEPSLSPITTASRPFVSWHYNDRDNNPQAAWSVRVISSAVYLSGAVNEVQRVTITGSPTGGTFTLTYFTSSTDIVGQTTTPIARNATNAVVQAALEALPGIGVGNVVVGGGTLPGTFITVTFQNALGAANIPQMKATPTFSGGVSTAIAVTTTTAGVGIDPATATNVYAQSGTDSVTRRVRVGSDLANATYRAYVRVTDSSGLVSGWAFRQWTQSVAAPATPSVVANPSGTSMSLSVALTATDDILLEDNTDMLEEDSTIFVDEGNPPSGNWRVAIEYHDSDWDGVTWQFVQDASGLVPDAGGNVVVLDRQARFGIARTYRALTYTFDPNADDWNASAWSATDTDTVTSAAQVWMLGCVTVPSLDMSVEPESALVQPQREAVLGVFQPAGRRSAIVVSDGPPKLATFTVTLFATSLAQRVGLEALLNADATLHLRDPMGRIWFVRPRKYALQTIHEASTRTDELHAYNVEMQEVERPDASPAAGPLAGTF